MRRASVTLAVLALAFSIAPSSSAGVSPPDTVGLVDPATGVWYLQAEDGGVESFYFGNPSDYPFTGDWDCDGVDTPGLYRQSDGFVYLRNSNTQGNADIAFFFGNPGDVPIAGDFDNDGCDTVSIYRPAEQRFYIINELGEDGGGVGAADYWTAFGNVGDTPFSGDFDGDGFDEVGLHRASTGLVYYEDELTVNGGGGQADHQFFYGNGGDRFVAGDWTGGGTDTVGVFRPIDSTFYLRHTNSPGFADEEHDWGSPDWLPVQGAFDLPGGLPRPFGLPSDPVMLVGAGDIADCDGGGAAATATLLDEVLADGSDGIVFTAGDNAYGDGTPQEFAECYDPTWGRHKDRTLPTPGNHDYNTEGATGYYEYFGAAAGNAGQGYYSYEAGAWHVVALNSNCNELGSGGCDPGSAQYEWLRQDLSASTAACTLAYWHHTVFSSGSHGSNNKMLPIFNLLYENGAEIVVTGHDHDYERFAPQTPTGELDTATGIRLFVVGTGGRSLRGFDTVVANSEVRFSDAYGIIRFDLFEDRYEWEFIPEQGVSFTDVGSGSCH